MAEYFAIPRLGLQDDCPANGVHLTNPCRTRDAGEQSANPLPPATTFKDIEYEYSG